MLPPHFLWLCMQPWGHILCHNTKKKQLTVVLILCLGQNLVLDRPRSFLFDVDIVVDVLSK